MRGTLAFEVTRSLFETARQYIEGVDVYADKASFEWTHIEGEQPIQHVGEKPERVKVPDYARLLPAEIQCFTTKGVYDDEHAHLSFIQGGGHGGSHPHWFKSSSPASSREGPRSRMCINRSIGLAPEAARINRLLQGGQIVQILEFPDAARTFGPPSGRSNAGIAESTTSTL